MRLETVLTRPSEGYTYLVKDHNGDSVERTVYHVNRDGTVQVSVPGSGLVDRKNPLPRENFEPVICLNPPIKCRHCENIANSVRHRGVCTNCSLERF